ncbi:transposase [Chryseobacterium culicis]|uniref:transposase n=1 Tax=Chryseobacterium culicis TaxID=680127 RepID=UPI001873C389|nr:transposase [Chryseobacterium culicis]MBE4947330.1 transposase [Chryseobacterium culicis]
MNFKEIHIGQLIENGVKESKIDILRITNFLRCSKSDVEKMYKEECINTDLLLRWSKLLEYDFFRLYSQHLILYAPPTRNNKTESKILPKFRKNLYTTEIIDFILSEISTGEMTRKEVLERYQIPKTTLNKWMQKKMKK